MKLMGVNTQYDGDGNPTGYPWNFANGNPASGSNTFDNQDRLLTFEGVITNWWRPDGLRAYKNTSSALYFLYDGGHYVAELDGMGNVLNRFVYGANGLAERYNPALNNTYVYTFDPSGNLVQRHIIGSSLAADYTASYDAFGQQTGCLTSGQGIPSTDQDAIGWGGQWGGYTDQETAGYKSGSTNPAYARLPLVLCGYRFYDPSTGRFLTRDPQGMEGGVNLYAYTRNNPVNFNDPMGLQKGGRAKPVPPDKPDLVVDADTFYYIFSLQHLSDSWEFLKGEGTTLNPVSMVKGVYNVGNHIYQNNGSLQSFEDIGVSFWDGLQFWNQSDLHSAGQSFMGDVLLVTPLMKRIPSFSVLTKGKFNIFSRKLPSGGYTLLRVDINGKQAFRIDWHKLPTKTSIPTFWQGKFMPHYHRRGPGGIERHRPYETGKGSRF